MIALVFLLALQLCAANKHKGLFQAHTDIVNEFELLKPHRVRFSDPHIKASDYSLTDIVPIVISNDDLVNVTCRSSQPSENDWVGAYAPLDLNTIATTVPVKFGFCDEDPNYLTTGVGILHFNLTNLRTDVGFVMYTNGLSDPVLVYSSDTTVSFENINQPLRPRIVPSGDPDVFYLVWSSATSTKPVLQWGTQSKIYENSDDAVTTTIPRESLCGEPSTTIGYRDLGLIHKAKFVGMTGFSNDPIYYRFGDEATVDFSEEFTLFTPPAAGKQPANRPTTVVLFDDLGRGSTDNTFTWNEYGRPAIYTSMSIGHLVQQGLVDAVYHGGDLSYASGYLAVWDFWLDMITPMSAGALYLSIVGNHESDQKNTSSLSNYNNNNSGGECSIPTIKLLPEPEPATVDAPYWSYDIGLIHFVGMSTEHNYSRGSVQYDWLENDLKSVDRTITPWVIFGGHRAMYVNSNACGTKTATGACAPDSDLGVMNILLTQIEPLLFKYRVNIGFWGHNHVYQRHAAVLNKTVIQHAVEEIDEYGNAVYYQHNPQSTVQFVIGTGGAGFTINAQYPQPEWNELVYYQYGYTRIQAVNASYLVWEWINSQTEVVIDKVILTQGDPTQPFVVNPFPTKSPVAPEVITIHDSEKLSDTDIAIIAFVLFLFLAVGLMLITYYRVRSKPDQYSQIDHKSLLESMHPHDDRVYA